MRIVLSSMILMALCGTSVVAEESPPAPPAASNTVCPVTGLPVDSAVGVAVVSDDAGVQVSIACATSAAVEHIDLATDEVKSWFIAAAKVDKVVDEAAGRVVDAPAPAP